MAFSISLKASDTDSVNLLLRPSRLTPPDSTRPSNLMAVRTSLILSSPLKISPLRSFWIFSGLMPPHSLIWKKLDHANPVGFLNLDIIVADAKKFHLIACVLSM